MQARLLLRVPNAACMVYASYDCRDVHLDPFPQRVLRRARRADHTTNDTADSEDGIQDIREHCAFSFA